MLSESGRMAQHSMTAEPAVPCAIAIGGVWAMQLQGNQLKGRYTPGSTSARARETDIALTKQ